MPANANTAEANHWQTLLEQAFQAAQSNDFQQAVQLCQHILTENETYAPAYAILGDVWKKLEKLENAEKFYGLAVKFAPRNLMFGVEHAKTLIQLERLDAATALLLSLQPIAGTSPTVPMLLADIAIRQRVFDRALQYLKEAQYKGAPALIEEQFALCYREQHHYEMAEKHLHKLLEATPQHLRALNMLANIYVDQRKMDEAIEAFDKVLSLDPTHYQAMIGRSTLYTHKKEYKEAFDLLGQALVIAPQQYRAYYEMGNLFFCQKQYERAIPYLQDAVKLNDTYLPAIQLLANTLFTVGRKQEAMPFIDTVLTKYPDYPAFKHIRAAILGETTEKAPEAYVHDLFNSYAENFDQHLLGALQYIVPQKLKETMPQIRTQLGDTRTNLSLLDLGCGTGLGAEVLMDITDFRVGVDLAPAMIDKARQKNIFSELYVGDVIRFMEQADRAYDMVIATDVLVYIGALESFYKESLRLLETSGYFIFSTEDGHDIEQYKILPSGRYVHNPLYIKKLAAGYPLTLLSHTTFPGRHEGGAPLDHSLYIFSRS